MEQLTLFSRSGQSRGLPKDLLAYTPNLVRDQLGYELMDRIIAAAPWQQKLVKMYDKQVLTPRLSAWYADDGTFDYNSLFKSAPNSWTPELLYLKELIEPKVGVVFNSVLLNYYRDGNDSVAWHSDNERVLGPQPTIASISFGEIRSFDIRNKSDHQRKYSILLEHGSLLVMKGDLQLNWDHRIAKSTRPMRPRLNLTFRVVNPKNQ